MPDDAIQPVFLTEATGHGHAPILDYAGPSSRGKFRLPAQSILDVTDDPDRLSIIETLAGQGGAILAILFALFTLWALITGATSGMTARNLQRHSHTIAIAGVLTIAETVVMLLVIQNTWRKTVLTVTPTDIFLRFWAPFSGTRRHRWPAEKLHDAHIRLTRIEGARAEFPELELDLWGEPQVRLFLGHPQAELQQFVRAIRRLQPPPVNAQ
jgi:hypothetical protein